MSLFDDEELCRGCRYYNTNCDKWGTVAPPCEREEMFYEPEPEEEEEEEEEEEDEQEGDR